MPIMKKPHELERKLEYTNTSKRRQYSQKKIWEIKIKHAHEESLRVETRNRTTEAYMNLREIKKHQNINYVTNPKSKID